MTGIKPTLESIQTCMKNPELIRNVCILAHVDHGKTTIADSLLATNRLVSKRMAGSIRYLDDRLDEQQRGITMKSSTVSLLNNVENEELLLNLIDTPGHIDFSSEVGAALRLCDGALIIVDLIEGVCVQTREAIKLSFDEKCKMILVLNKFDKLFVELKKDVNEIFQLILHTIENCNAIIAELYQYEYSTSMDIEDTGLLFSPETGNVIFASALDGWGFTTKQIVKIFINVINKENFTSLNKKLWNFDAYVDSKTNTIKTGAIEKNKTNLFTQLCLKTISHIYSTIVIQMEKNKIENICKKLQLPLTKDMTHNDCKIQLKAIMQAWSPLADTILEQSKEIIQSPKNINDTKIRYLFDYNNNSENELIHKSIENLMNLVKNCSNNDPTIAYVSKMFCVSNRNLSQNKPKIFVPRPRTEPKPEPKPEPDVLERDYSIIALTRVLTGALHVDQEIYILPPNYNPTKNTELKSVKIKELYILFGRELVSVDHITAGNICGIGGLENLILRSATLSTTTNCVSIIEQPTLPPIVRNSIEPKNPKDLPILRQGLKLLMQSDSCVDVLIQQTGEHVLLTAGDVHLAKCLEDLTTKFAQIEINVSSPIVSLRETITTSTSKLENIDLGQIKLDVILVQLPEVLERELGKNYKLIKQLEEYKQVSSFELVKKRLNSDDLQLPQLKQFKNDTTNCLINSLKEQINVLFESLNWIKYNIWHISKMNDCINLLMNGTNDYQRNIFETLDENDQRSCFDNIIINAFNNCCKAGPICEEPLKNCVFIIKKIELNKNDILEANIKNNANIELNLCSGLRDVFDKQLKRRLMEPIFSTSIQVNTNILGKVYTVINKRHGKVIDAVGMDEQEKQFLVKAHIPVVESTGFVNEIRKTTSGQAIPNLKFSHFEIIDGDPFYEPLIENNDSDDSDEEINVEASTRAMKLRKEVRKRKGLYVEEQVVVHAEKQRTLNKKK